MALTFAQIKDEVIRLANESPDFEYPNDMGGCVYNPTRVSVCDEDGAETGETIVMPSCIFGKAFINLNSPVPDELNQENGISVVLTHFNVTCTESEGKWANDVQNNQDNGIRWGTAIDVKMGE